MTRMIRIMICFKTLAQPEGRPTATRGAIRGTFKFSSVQPLRARQGLWQCLARRRTSFPGRAARPGRDAPSQRRGLLTGMPGPAACQLNCRLQCERLGVAVATAVNASTASSFSGCSRRAGGLTGAVEFVTPKFHSFLFISNVIKACLIKKQHKYDWKRFTTIRKVGE